MPPGKYGMQEEWEKEGDHGIDMDFLLPTGIILKFAVSRNDTIKTIKKVCLVLTKRAAADAMRPCLQLIGCSMTLRL